MLIRTQCRMRFLQPAPCWLYAVNLGYFWPAKTSLACFVIACCTPLVPVSLSPQYSADDFRPGWAQPLWYADHGRWQCQHEKYRQVSELQIKDLQAWNTLASCLQGTIAVGLWRWFQNRILQYSAHSQPTASELWYIQPLQLRLHTGVTCMLNFLSQDHMRLWASVPTTGPRKSQVLYFRLFLGFRQERTEAASTQSSLGQMCLVKALSSMIYVLLAYLTSSWGADNAELQWGAHRRSQGHPGKNFVSLWLARHWWYHCLHHEWRPPPKPYLSQPGSSWLRERGANSWAERPFPAPIPILGLTRQG